ncbi:hypothetical protein [Dongia sp.]
MQTTDNYNDILREARESREGLGGAWRLVAVLGILLVGVSSLWHAI